MKPVDKERGRKDRRLLIKMGRRNCPAISQFRRLLL